MRKMVTAPGVFEPYRPSGKWVQRVPHSLHLKLIKLAEAEGVSMNQLVVSILAEAVGKKNAVDKKRATVRR